MKTDNAIVGINFSELDNIVINYVDFLSTKIPLKTVNNLYVFTARESFEALKKDYGNDDAKKLYDSILRKMEEEITPKYKNVKHVKNIVRAGLFVQEYYDVYKKLPTDLIIMGKGKDSHGTMSKFVIRHIPAHTLIIPEEAKTSLKKIVIALDQTDFSVKILHEAVNFCKLIDDDVEITFLHVGHLHSRAELFELFGEVHQLNIEEFNKVYQNYLDDLKGDFINFIKENTKDIDNLNYRIEFIGETRKPHHGLLNYIKADKADFLILGTKSHSLLDTVIVGSFAEKIISHNNKIPMLLIKTREEKR